MTIHKFVEGAEANTLKVRQLKVTFYIKNYLRSNRKHNNILFQNSTNLISC